MKRKKTNHKFSELCFDWSNFNPISIPISNLIRAIRFKLSSYQTRDRDRNQIVIKPIRWKKANLNFSELCYDWSKSNLHPNSISNTISSLIRALRFKLSSNQTRDRDGDRIGIQSIRRQKTNQKYSELFFNRSK